MVVEGKYDQPISIRVYDNAELLSNVCIFLWFIIYDCHILVLP